MIKVDAIEIKNVRGIVSLDLPMNGKSFTVSGPNGTGKSGVVDAIEFCLTGDISRLHGRGTDGVTLQRHGPHVTKSETPKAAEVAMVISIPSLGKSARISRNMSNPKKLHIDPESPDVREVMSEIERHPELVLSRREIIKFILVEAGQRSKEVQALLRITRVNEIRGALGTASNRLNTSEGKARQAEADAQKAFHRHLGTEEEDDAEWLSAVNGARTLLSLPRIESLNESAVLDEGLDDATAIKTFDKESALRDFGSLKEGFEGTPTFWREDANALIPDIAEVNANPDLFRALKLEAFIAEGLDLVDSSLCPLCDYEWSDIDALKEHLRLKVESTGAVKEIRDRIMTNAETLSTKIQSLISILRTCAGVAKKDSNDELAVALNSWTKALQVLAGDLESMDKILQMQPLLEGDLINRPDGVVDAINGYMAAIEAKPDQNDLARAQTYLVMAQDRYAALQNAIKGARKSKVAADAALASFEAYNRVSESLLMQLYEAVEKDFSKFYRKINAGDEIGFGAQFVQGEGSLELNVNFYDRGMYPPSAYHSEGHQDGMGVCLFLALMRRLFGDDFTFAVLDDVVMSIDSGHRAQFCRLLMEEFPNTQFVITTHDQIWARQIVRSGLVNRRQVMQFQNWNVDTGPAFAFDKEVWERIEDNLTKNDVPAAAHRLRLHLESSLTEIADQWSPMVPFSGDAQYDLGDLFGAVVGKHGEILGQAAASANSWANESAKSEVAAMKETRRVALANYQIEQWIVNKAIHYNDWGTFSKADFKPVVEAARVLLALFECPEAECGDWYQLEPDRNPGSFRCNGNHVNLNLKMKEKV